MSELRPGIEASDEFEVAGRLLTDVGGTLGTSVLSTPAMIAMMERTSTMLVYPLLDEGQATVGFEVCVRHVGAALSTPTSAKAPTRAQASALYLFCYYVGSSLNGRSGSESSR